MQENFQAPPINPKLQWLGTAETLSIIGSIGGAIIGFVVYKPLAIASIPLSVSVALSLMNRRLLLDSLKQNNLAAIAQVIQEQVKSQTQLETLTGQVAQLEQVTNDTINQHQAAAQAEFSQLNEQLQQLNTIFSQSQDTNNQAISQISQENSETSAKLVTLNEQLEQLQQLTDKLVQEQNNKLIKEQAKIASTVDCLREIETCTQSIRINPISATAFFNRGLSYQRLGDREAAIGDYTEAIKLNPNYAEAYQSRGLAYADLGDKKAAVQDLREAARLFFESGEIDKYQIARDLSKKFHELDMPTESETAETSEIFEEIALESLFSF